MIGERLALWWVDRYTGGIRDDLRDERRAEIASDVWEHRNARGAGWATQLTIASRCLRGVPADLSWRRARRRRRRALPGRDSALRGLGWVITGMAYGLFVIWHGWFSTALVGLDLYGADWAPGDVERWSRISGVLAAALVGGALLLRSAPRLGAALVGSSVLASTALMWWLLPLQGPCAVAVTTGAVVLARRRRQALRLRAAG